MSSNSTQPSLGDLLQEAETIKEFVFIIQLVKYASLTSMVLYLYNYVTTLDDEVSVMWKSSRGYGKMLYYSLRYLSLFSTIFINIGLFDPNQTNKSCNGRDVFYWVSSVAIALITDFALQLRIYALYEGSKRIFYLFLFTSIVMTAYFATILVLVLRNEDETMVTFGPGQDEFICNGGQIPAIYDKIWIAKLLNEGLMFILSLRKGIMNILSYGGKGTASKLTTLLVKDSALYFLVVGAFCLVSQLVWALAGSKYIEVPVGISLAMGSIMSQHLLVNVRLQVSEKMGTAKYTGPPMTENIEGTQIFSRHNYRLDESMQSALATGSTFSSMTYA